MVGPSPWSDNDDVETQAPTRQIWPSTGQPGCRLLDPPPLSWRNGKDSSGKVFTRFDFNDSRDVFGNRDDVDFAEWRLGAAGGDSVARKPEAPSR
jgi:hypothetical protein